MEVEVAALEKDVQSYVEQLETVNASLQNDPDNDELLTLKTQIEQGVADLQNAIAEIEALVEESKPKAPPSPAEEPKWSKEKHPAFQADYKRPGAASSAPEEAHGPATYSVNDNIQAKYSTDNKFYPARITSKTGSSADPVYTVIFKGYGNTETVRGSDIRPLHNDKKRKADAPPSSASAASAPDTPIAPGVISAAANINPALATQARKEPSKVGDGPARPAKVPRKITASKQLEAGKSKWQQFAAKGKFGKGTKKDSMFRTGESPTARVGFTGSGSAMRKDAARTRHVYDKDADQGE